MNVSDTGIVLVGRQKTEKLTDVETLDISYDIYTVTDYQIGDTIDIVNPEKLRNLVQMKNESVSEDGAGINLNLVKECRQKLIDEGEYISYTIEGIVEQDFCNDNYYT